jgi:TRAP-type uncharacterized transport system substrate-binding protein
MTRSRHLLGTLFAFFVLLPAASSLAQGRQMLFPAAVGSTQAAKTYDELKRETNDIAVSIVVSGLSCTCARFAEDIRNVINDLKPNGIRILPVLGVGGLQNLKDVLFLRSMDMAVVDQDNLLLLKQRDPKLYANIEQRVNYITKLYTAEFHVLANNEIKSYDDLKNRKVNFNLKDSQTEVTADRIFTMLDIPVERSYYDNDEAIQKLLKREISAMIVLTGGPQAALAKLRAEDGVHFLALDEDSLPGHYLSAIRAEYLTIELTHKLYPNLIREGTSVPTIANHALLVSYAWPENSERYRRIARFVNELFGKTDQFNDGARHPKWAEFDVRTDIPGWTRFKPAANWIAAHEPVAAGNEPGNVQEIVEKVLENYKSPNGRKVISANEKDFIIKEVVKQIRDKQTSMPISR